MDTADMNVDPMEDVNTKDSSMDMNIGFDQDATSNDPSSVIPQDYIEIEVETSPAENEEKPTGSAHKEDNPVEEHWMKPTYAMFHSDLTDRGTKFMKLWNERMCSEDNIVANRVSVVSRLDVLAARKKLWTGIDNVVRQRDYSNMYAYFRYDEFIYQVEERRCPTLASYPVVVVFRNMVCSLNKVAKELGITVNMTVTTAQEIAPNLLSVPCKFNEYAAVMDTVEAILSKYDPFLTMSCDSVLVRLTHFSDLNRCDLKELVFGLKRELFDTIKIRCSAGVGPTTTIAKLASFHCGAGGVTFVKPNATSVRIFMNSEEHFVKNCGLHPRLEAALRIFNINTIDEIWEQRLLLSALVSLKSLRFLIGIVLGISTEPLEDFLVEKHPVPKFLSRKLTISPTKSMFLLACQCHKVCKLIEETLKAENMLCKVFIAYIRTTDMKCWKKAYSFTNRTNRSAVFLSAAAHVLKQIFQDSPETMVKEVELRVCNLMRVRYVDEDGENDMELSQPWVTPTEAKRCLREKSSTIHINDFYQTLKKTHARLKKNETLLNFTIPKRGDSLLRRQPICIRGSIYLRDQYVPIVKRYSKTARAICPNCEWKVVTWSAKASESLMIEHVDKCLLNSDPKLA